MFIVTEATQARPARGTAQRREGARQSVGVRGADGFPVVHPSVRAGALIRLRADR
ncbi:hypothetical protein [Streptomyces cadmiisoli]|uniref:hypothetical protein n=1 Tax=Streptomyces cadmiisoli TaxID=2184053 RepID=UPI0013A6BF5A|nr:hypothetical protein [Streptomyces cadmiisoli]